MGGGVFEGLGCVGFGVVVVDVDGVALVFEDAGEVEEAEGWGEGGGSGVGLGDEEGMCGWVEEDDVDGVSAPVFFLVGVDGGGA